MQRPVAKGAAFTFKPQELQPLREGSAPPLGLGSCASAVGLGPCASSVGLGEVPLLLMAGSELARSGRAGDCASATPAGTPAADSFSPFLQYIDLTYLCCNLFLGIP